MRGWGIDCLRRLLGVVALATLGVSSFTIAPSGASTGSPAWVRVSVATLWDHPTSARAIDRPALRVPAAIRPWLGRLTVADRLAFDNEIATQALFGEQLLVLGHQGPWSRVELPDQRGSRYPNGIIAWVPSVQLTTTAPPSTGAGAVVVTAKTAPLRSAPGGVVGRAQVTVSFGTVLPVVGRAAGYELVGMPGGSEGAIGLGSVAPVGGGTVPGSAIVTEAERFLGLPYLWGGTSAYGYDCSGLVYAVYARYGIVLPRDASDQQHAGPAVALASLHPGDLLFFAGPGGKGTVDHVGIYAGGGEMVDAPFTGASIELVAMRTIPVWSDFAGAIRVTGVH